MEVLKYILICAVPTAVVCYFLIKSAKIKPDYGSYTPKSSDFSRPSIEIIDCKNK